MKSELAREGFFLYSAVHTEMACIHDGLVERSSVDRWKMKDVITEQMEIRTPLTTSSLQPSCIFPRYVSDKSAGAYLP
jgi:hypothetical protein